MVEFLFIINKSFLKYKHHPITIPKIHYDYLESENLAGDTVSITSPYGSMQGVIIFSKAGYGPYYQIQVRGGYANDPLSQFHTGQEIRVEVGRIRQKINVNLVLL
jgi:hypothetical protein